MQVLEPGILHSYLYSFPPPDMNPFEKVLQVLTVLWAAFASCVPRWEWSPTPDTSGPSGLAFPAVLSLGSILDPWASPAVTPLWIPFSPDPFASWDFRGDAGYWAYGNANASADTSFWPFPPVLDIVTEVFPFVGPIFEEVADTTPLVEAFDSADNITADANDTERVAPPVDSDDPATAQLKVIVWSTLSFVLLVASLLPRDTPRLVKKWLDDASGKSALEADTRLLSDKLRNLASTYDQHRAALAKRDEEQRALAAKAGLDAIDGFPLDMHGLEVTQTVVEIVVDKCKVEEARLASLDSHRRKVENQQRQDKQDLETHNAQLLGQAHTLRHETAEETREAELRAEAHDIRVEQVQVEVEASKAKVSIAQKLATSLFHYGGKLAAALRVFATENRGLEAENQALRRHGLEGEQALERRRFARQQRRKALEAQIAAAQADLAAGQEENAAALAQRRERDNQHHSAIANTQQTEGALVAELSAQTAEAVVLTRTLEQRRTATQGLAHDHDRLRSDYIAKTQHTQDLEERVAGAQNSHTVLRGDLEDARQARHDELATLTDAVADRHSTGAATAQELAAAELTLREAEERQTVEVGAARTELHDAEAENRKALAPLNGLKHTRTRQLASLDARQSALQAEQASLDTQGRELDACFEEHAENWTDMREEREYRQEKQKTQLAEYQAQFDDARAVTCAAQRGAAVANEDARAALLQAKADTTERNERQETFNVELARFREGNGALTSEHAAAKAEYTQYRDQRDTLLERKTRAHEKLEWLPIYAGSVASAEEDHDRKFAKRTITPEIAKSEMVLENTKNTIECLRLNGEALEKVLMTTHKEMYDDEQELQKVKKDLAAERVKTFTYGRVLEKCLKTPDLVDSSGEFSRSPSLTPPPETPRLDASVGRPAVPDEMDIAESSTARK